jgi:hypothetical protein
VAAATVSGYHGTPGRAHAGAPTASTQTSRREFPRAPRRIPSQHFSKTQTAPGLSRPAATSGGTRAPSVNIDGVSSRDSQFTNYELKFEPPDQGLCKGNGFVLEPVNSAYRIYRTNGTSLRGPFNVNDLFNVGGAEFTSDPRCWFDKSTQTWFATILFLNASGTQGTQLIAVRHDPSPLGLWQQYSIDATDPGGNGCPCFGDQPRIGIDQTNLYITADEFSILGTQFNGAEMWVIDKSDLVNGVASPHFAHFAHLTTDTVAPQPALSQGTPDAEYLLSSEDTGTGSDQIGVWAVTNRNKVASGGTPTLTRVLLDSEKYANPPQAPQKGSSSKLDSGDDRMQSTQFVGGTVWGELSTTVKPYGDNTSRAGGGWFQVKPNLGKSGITSASMVRQGYLASSGQYQLYPVVQPDANGNAAAIFTLTSKSRFPSVGYSMLRGGAADFGPTALAAAGTGPYITDTPRWGDYSFAVPDDQSDAAWLATEYVPPKSSQTTNGRVQNWGTRVLKIRLG